MRTTSDILADLGVKLRSTQPGNQKALCPQCVAPTEEKARPVPIGLDRRQGGSIPMPQRRLRLAWGTFL